ncbi:Shwachman-Bodian-diamond syndrome protein [Pleomassaria siparia CBS 279.74]|uniref:Shwachman-Bodian-diamond syndrome protein n=1 Tax=Pleomassaria siparia CBS 279.74 TaxID=1314801 RepID=A0A6G1KSA7_9PLEO|nr:Shwachman-Bodian-diamond syndrome protein [Pleomassaria siparia CBS 279.74]
MPMIQQPSGQIKLTNVSLVRLKKGKKRYEIACYKNKVLEWRSKVETNIDNVLQIENVFINVSKGQVAPKADLDKSFDKMPMKKIIEHILEHGELQVGEKERHAELDRINHEVIDIVAGMLVDPKTKIVYTSGMIGKALDTLTSQSHQAEKPEVATTEAGEEKGKVPAAPALPKWTGVTANKPAKRQALYAVKALIAHQPIPVMRARMSLKITCPAAILKHNIKSAPKPTGSEAAAEGTKSQSTVKDTILSFVERVESQEVTGDLWTMQGFVEPGAYKPLTEFIGTKTKGAGTIEVLEMAIKHEDGE